VSEAQEKPAPHAVSDNDLLRRYLDGDSGAFQQLVERYQRELMNFLVRFTGDAALAEDVFQEAFLQLHISGGSFDFKRALKPWLFTIAANKARDAMRSRWRRQAAPLDAAVYGGEDEQTSYASLMPSNIPAPNESLENQETRDAVQKIVRKMPENLRMVLILSYFHEFPYQEIAEILGVPLGTVKSRLHAAVKHFANEWKTYAGRSGHDNPT
jgi:RNA polymerase sigma-70 factor (ECF subfamily)